MPPSRQSDFRGGRAERCAGVGQVFDLPKGGSQTRPTAGRRSAFTLIELIFVLALLAIGALFVASSMGGFFRGRALNFEARRMLSLAHYGQSRAVSEGVPVVLWIDPKESTYGLTVLASFKDDLDGDTRATNYTVDPSLTLETPANDVPLVSERDDEKLGIAEGISVIRFNPDGFIDETSVRKITIRLGAEAALELAPTASRLSYEIRPASDVN